MPRKLHPDGVPEFLEHYEIAKTCAACGSGSFMVVVFDTYGTMPKDEDAPAAQRGVGEFVSAVVVCNDCGRSETIERARLAAKQPAE